MADDLRIQIRAEADEAASARLIEGQLPSISKQIKERVKVGVEVDEGNINSQIKSATRKTGTSGRVSIPVELGVQADTLKRLLDQQVKTLKKRAEKIEAPLNWTKFNNEFEKNTLQGFQQASKELRILRAETESWGAGLAKLIPMNPAENISKYIDELSVNTKKLHAGFSNLRGGIPKEAVTSFEQLAVAQKELSAIPTTDIEARSKKYNEAASILNKLSVSYRDLKTASIEASAPIIADTLEKRFEKAQLALEEFKTKYSAFLTDPKLVAQYNNLAEQASKIVPSSPTFQKDIQNLSAGMQRFEAAARAAGKAQRSLTDETANNAKKMASWMVMGGAIASAFRFVRDVVSNVQELNKAFIDIQIVTNKNNAEVTGLLSSYSKLAKQLGATTVEVANSAVGWLRQGKTIEETNTLIKNSMILSKVGGIEAAQSTEYMTSASKGYNVAIKDTLSIVDKISSVDLIAAVSAAGLAEGMSEVANNANMAGISMDKLLGYLAAVGEVTQDPMSEVGHSFSTMFSRMGNIKLARLKDYQNNGEDLSNVETVLRGLGIELRDGVDSFRNFGDVLDEVASKWETYSEVEQRALATAFASKNNMEDFLVLMKNYGNASDYASAATNSAGTALQKFSKYQEGIEAKQKKLTANMEAFSSAILDSDLIKSSYDSGSGILGFLTEVTKLLGALPTLGTAAAAALSIGKIGLVRTVPNADTLSGQSLSFGLKSNFKQLIQSDMTLMDQYQLGWKTASDEVAFFNDTLGKASVAAQEQAASLKNGTITSQVWGAQQLASAKAAGALGIQSKIASVGVSVLKTAMNALIGLGISLAITGISTAITSMAQAHDKAIEKAKELSAAWEEQSNKLKTAKETISDISDDYEKLSKGVDSFGNNIALNTEEYTRYNEIVNKIADLFPEMINGYTQEGNAILKTKGNVEALTQAYKDAEKAANDTIIRQSSDVFKGMSAATSLGSGWFQSMFSSNASRVLLGNNLLDYITSGNKERVLQVKGLEGYKDIISDLGLSDTSVDTIMKNGDTVAAYIRSLQAGLNSYTSQVTPIVEAYLSQDEKFGQLSSDMKDVVSSVISSFDYEFLNQFQGSVPRLMTWVNRNIVDALADSDIPMEIANMLTLQGKYQQSEISVGAYDSALFGFNKSLRNLATEVQSPIKEIFMPNTDSMVGRTRELLKDEFDGLVKTLTLEDITIAYKLENKGPISWEELLAQIAKVKEQSTLGIDSLKTAVATFTSAQSTAAEVLKSLSDGAVLTSENFKKLEDAGYNLSDVVDSSSGSFRTIADAIDQANKATAAKLQSDINLAKSNALTEYQKNALELVTQEIALNKAREDGIDINTEYFKQIEKQNDVLKNRQKELEDSIKGYDRLTSEIQYATSAYKKWLDAQNAPESGDQYRGTIDAIKRMKELLKEGRVGTQEYQAAADYLVPKEIQGQGVKAVQKYTKTLDKYFKDGSAGALQFAKDLAKADLANYDPKTQQFELFSTSLSDIADKMGITEDAAYALFQMLNELTPDGKGFIFDNPNNKSTEQINAANKAAQEYANSLVAVKDAQDALNKAQTESEKAAAQSALDNLIKKSKELGQNLWSSIIGVGEGAPEQLSLQEQINKINDTLAALSIEIPATVKFDTVAELAKILDPFKLPENQPKVIVNGEESESFTNIKAELSNIQLALDKGGKIVISAEKSDSYTNVTGALADQNTLNQGANIVISAEKADTYSNVEDALAAQNTLNEGSNVLVSGTQGESYSAVTDALTDQSTLNEGANFTISVTDNAATVIEGIESTIDGAVKYAEENPVVITVKAQGETASETPKPISDPNDLMEFVNSGEWQSPNPSVKPLEEATEESDYLVDSLGEIPPAANNASDSLGELPEAVNEATQEVQKQIPWWEALWNWITGQGQPDVTVDTEGAKGQVETFVNEMSQKEIRIKARVEPSGVAADSGRGNVKKPETALVAEKRPEILVRDGQYTVLEDPQLLNLKPGDQLIGGAESEKILNGRRSARSGRALDDYGDSGGGIRVSGSTTLTKTSSSSKKSSNTAFLKTLESWIDWFPRILEAAQKTTEQFKRIVDNAIGYIRKNGALEKVVASVRDEIAKNEQAAAVYQAKADEIAAKTKLSADWVRKIQEGSPEVEVVSDKKLKEKIDAYTEWWDKAQDVKDALVDLREQENELAKQRLDNIINDYENRIARIDFRMSSGQANIDRKTTVGQQINAADYNPMVSAAQDRISTLAAERSALEQEFNNLIASGVIQKDSDAWHEYTGQIEDLNAAMVQAEIDVQGFKDAIASITITNLQYAMSALESTSQTMQDLISLNEAQGTSPSGTTFSNLIKNSKEQIKNLEAQNDALYDQQQGLDVLSEKYQNLQSQIMDNESAIMQAKIQQEQWADSIADLTIKDYERQKEALQKTNEQYERRLAIQKAEADLAKAEQKKVRMLVNGQFTYVQDAALIQEKQEALDKVMHDENLAKLDDLIAAVEESKTTNNLYDAIGNEIGLSPMLSENLSRLLSASNPAGIMAQNIMSNVMPRDSLPMVNPNSQGSVSYTFQFKDVTLHEVNDTKDFWDQLMRESASVLPQVINKH
jgi:TP901 family phage tail tape measure protein